MKRHGAYQRPGALDPWRHNRIVRRRKQYRRIAEEISGSVRGMSAAFRQLAASAVRAGESLRNVRRALETQDRSGGAA